MDIGNIQLIGFRVLAPMAAITLAHSDRVPVEARIARMAVNATRRVVGWVRIAVGVRRTVALHATDLTDRNVGECLEAPVSPIVPERFSGARFVQARVEICLCEEGTWHRHQHECEE